MGVLLTACGDRPPGSRRASRRERRWPQAAGHRRPPSAALLLYVLLPPVIFFNLAAERVDVEHGVGLRWASSPPRSAPAAWWVASGVLRLPRRRPAPSSARCSASTPATSATR
jgi:hypothetical protein